MANFITVPWVRQTTPVHIAALWARGPNFSDPNPPTNQYDIVYLDEEGLMERDRVITTNYGVRVVTPFDFPHLPLGLQGIGPFGVTGVYQVVARELDHSVSPAYRDLYLQLVGDRMGLNSLRLLTTRTDAAEEYMIRGAQQYRLMEASSINMGVVNVMQTVATMLIPMHLFPHHLVLLFVRCAGFVLSWTTHIALCFSPFVRDSEPFLFSLLLTTNRVQIEWRNAGWSLFGGGPGGR